MTTGSDRLRRWNDILFRAAAHIVQRITKPSPGVEPRQRRRIRLLAAFLLLMSLNTLLSSMILRSIGGYTWIVLLVTSSAFILSYAVSRTRYWGAALILAITLPAIPPLAISIFKPPEVSLAAELVWLAMPLMFSSLMLSVRQTVLLALAYMALVAALKISNLIDIQDMAPVMGYISVIAVIVISISVIRTRDQAQIENKLVELEHAEKLLRENNEQLDTVLDSVPCGILVIDEETHIIQDINSYASNLIGTRPEEVIGRECHLFICPAERGKCPVSDFGRLDDNSERVLITASGKSVPILKNVVRVTMKSSLYLLETFIDITERKQMEKSLRESEQKFSLAFRSSPQEICITRISDGKTIEINDSFTRSTGYTREEIIGKNSTALNIWKPGERERMLAILKEKGRVENEEFEFRRKSGEVRTQLFSAEPLTIGGEECLISITTDITNRKRAEKLQADEISVLTLLSHGVELNELLDAIVRLGESHNPSIKGSVLLLDPSKGSLVHAAGPCLPNDYVELLKQGVPIGPNSGSCGTAAYRKKRVIIPDIETSHAYPDVVVKTTIENGLRACWSQPIIASNGDLLGTIANYSSLVGEPAPADLMVIEWSARIAALAIERKKAENALKESEEKFSKAFHASPDSISISRMSDGAFFEVNESYVKNIGYSREELVGHNANDLNLWADPAQRKNMLRKVRRHIIMKNEEIRLRTKSGEIRTQLMSSEYVSLGGEPCLLVVSTDITERKRMEDSLADEATRRRILIDGSRDGIVILDQNGAAYEANRRFAEMLGYPLEEVLKFHVWDWEAVSSKADVKEMLRTVDESGDHFTTQHRRKDGTTIDVEISTNGAMFAGQKLIFCVCRDISERNRMEKALRESEEKFSRAFYTIPEAISITRLSDGTFVEVNDTFTRLSGFPREKLIGRSAKKLELWADKGKREELIYLIKKRGHVENEEVQLLTKSGEVRTTLLSADIINISGEPCLLVISTDISERKRAEEKLKEALTGLERSSAQLAATNKELETFSYSVSHDLRSPLRSIDGFSQALIEDYQDALDEKGRDYLSRLRGASQKMGELIDGILKLSRLTRSEMHREKVDLSSLAREIAGRLQETQPDRRAKFIIEDKLTATGDPQLVRVLLENLLDNAWKFTVKKTTARIEFGAEHRNGRQNYFIRDNGAGFDMAYADKLFGAFQRLHEVTEFPGTGIGLATVQRIINRHGGVIWAEGKVGKGATFHFTLD